MADSAMIRLVQCDRSVLRGLSVLMAIAAMATGGCAARSGVGIPAISTSVPETSALILPPPGTLSIVSVIQRQYSNAVEQEVVLSTSATTPGENFLRIEAFGPAQTVAMSAGTLAFRPVRHNAVRREITSRFPGRSLPISTNFVRNAYGPFGYAYGRGAGNDGCLYGWQQIRSDVADRDNLTNRGMIQVRLRVCEAGASEKTLVELMYGFTIVGGFSGGTWNPYGKPASVDSEIGGGEPLRVALDDRPQRKVAPDRVSRRNAVADRPVARNEGRSIKETDAENAVIVPSPSGGATNAEENITVPSPSCVEDGSQDSTCD